MVEGGIYLKTQTTFCKYNITQWFFKIIRHLGTQLFCLQTCKIFNKMLILTHI